MLFNRHWILGLLLFAAAPLQAGLRVFACEPEWGALVEELAGPDASVYVATTPQQDVHHIQARPSLIAQVRRADLVICTGADLEVGWLPVLLRRANNPSVLPGSPGYFVVSDHVRLLNKPARLDRAHGDVHPGGNPHIQLDPRNYLPVAEALAQRLSKLDEEKSGLYEARARDFLARWQTAIDGWEQKALPLRNMPIVVYHDAWVYLNTWLGLKQLAELEPKPGIAPTSAHLSSVLKLMHTEPARVIIRAPYQDPRASDWLHRHTDIPIRVLPYTVGGNDKANNLFGLFNSTLDMLLQVAK